MVGTHSFPTKSSGNYELVGTHSFPKAGKKAQRSNSFQGGGRERDLVSPYDVQAVKMIEHTQGSIPRGTLSSQGELSPGILSQATSPLLSQGTFSQATFSPSLHIRQDSEDKTLHNGTSETPQFSTFSPTKGPVYAEYDYGWRGGVSNTSKTNAESDA